MLNNKELSTKILELLNGKDNIESNAICMTRLRVSLKEKVNTIEDLKNLDGVLGVVSQEEKHVQIVLGPGKVNKVGEEFSKLTGISLGEVDKNINNQSVTAQNLEDITKENKKMNKEKHNGKIQQLLQKIANVFVPILPAIIASGLIQGITNVINVTTKGAFNEVWWYQSIRTVGWATFAYLAIFVCMNAAKEFSGTPILGAVIGALFVGNASMPLLMKIGEDGKLILPITQKPYLPSMGGLLAALFMGIIIAYIEKSIRKVMPDILDTFFTPLFTLIISVFIAILIIQPLGEILTKGIFSVLDVVYNKLGIVGGYILAAGFLPLVSVGLHQALTPIHVMLNNPEGPTQGINYLLPILMMAGGGQVGAGLALYLKTKNKKLKQLTRDSLPIGILGIGEPMMYAVTLPLGKPFLTACLGSGFGGMLAAMLHVGTITQGVSGLFGLLIVQPGTQLLFIISMVGAYVGGFVLTYFFGVDEKRIDEIYG